MKPGEWYRARLFRADRRVMLVHVGRSRAWVAWKTKRGFDRLSLVRLRDLSPDGGTDPRPYFDMAELHNQLAALLQWRAERRARWPSVRRRG